MSKVVDLKQYRTHQAEVKSYGAWQQRFGESYGLDTRPVDLSDRVVSYLATPGDDSNTAFYELIMGTLGYGAAGGFYHLGNEEQLKVVDIHLFLADQVRFEMMRRIGWLRLAAVEGKTLIELITDFETLRREMRNQPPELVETHPEYDAFRQQALGDREVFIRRLLQAALEAFKKRLGD